MLDFGFIRLSLRTIIYQWKGFCSVPSSFIPFSFSSSFVLEINNGTQLEDSKLWLQLGLKYNSVSGKQNGVGKCADIFHVAHCPNNFSRKAKIFPALNQWLGFMAANISDPQICISNFFLKYYLTDSKGSHMGSLLLFISPI